MAKHPKVDRDVGLRAHQKPWSATEHYERVLRVATATAYFAVTSPELDEIPDYRREILGNVLWFMTCAPSGKYTTRYRTAAVVATESPTLRHEHVYTRKTMIHELLSLPSEDLDALGLRQAIQDALRRKAVGCTVTLEEHRLLSRYDKSHVGWERYEAAGIRVLDMNSGDAFDATEGRER